ncbi:MAG: exosortase A [Simplicispira sp.]|nr:exosortase A [Simplicispira sp.]
MPVLQADPPLPTPENAAVGGGPLPLPLAWRRPLAVLVLLLAAIVATFWHSAWGMAMIWARSDTYAHGFVVPLISLWLVWRQRAVLAPLVPRPGRWAWVPMAGAAALWLVGDLVAVNAATQLALVALVVFSVPAVLGWHVAKVLAFPLGFLFFAVPMGDFLLPRLMEWTADFTVLALQASGIPVYREGLQFIIPSGAWSVVEACSGIRYLIASLTVGCLFAYLSYQKTRKRLVFIGVAILVPLIANWVRAYLIVMLGHFSGNTLATGVDHLIYGWLFFGIVIGVMFLIGARWTDPLPAPQAVASAAPNFDQNSLRPSSIKRYVLLFLIVLAPQGVLAVLDLGTQTQPVQLATPAVVAPWRATPAPPSTWSPAFQKAAAHLDTGLVNAEGQAVGLHVSYYRQQDYERKLIGSENVLVASKDAAWASVGRGSAQARLQGQALQVDSAVLRQHTPALGSAGQRLLVWRFYWVNGRFTASDPLGKIHGALGRITGQGDDGAHIVVYTPLLHAEEAQADAAARLQAYLDSQGAALTAALRQTREQH